MKCYALLAFTNEIALLVFQKVDQCHWALYLRASNRVMSTKRLQELIELEIDALRNIPMDGSLEAAMEMIVRQVHEGSGKVVVCGVGKAGELNSCMVIWTLSVLQEKKIVRSQKSLM